MKLWGGRFEENNNSAMEDFHSSIAFDARLYREDIRGSIAHAHMLGKQGIISGAEMQSIVDGLAGILEDIEAGKVEFSKSAEDIHMNVEELLTGRIGEAGKKLHTGRSRNDQVALDMRMYVLRACDDLRTALLAMMGALLDTAGANTATVMPGYTHMQRAQPVTMAHHLMAYFEMFRRDLTRLADCRARTDEMPLGAGALAGSTFALDRQAVANELGFAAITRNSIDSVSDRDFCLEFCFCCATIMMHLSRMCEEFVLWSSAEFGFVTMSDTYATGSSIMPQKKNPDAAELVRGKTGRVYGALMGLLTMMKGLPLAYDKDMQEDKEQLFDAFDTALACLNITTGMLSTLSFNKDVMRKGAAGGFANATDAADYLAKKGVPFRTAHEVIGKLVLACLKQGRALEELSIEELRAFHKAFDEDVYDAISLETCVGMRKLPGGPAPSAVQAHIDEGRAFIGQNGV